MANKWETLWNALVEVCEEYNKMKEKVDEKESFNYDIPETTYDKGSVVAAMAEKGWKSYEMDWVLDAVTNPAQAKAAVGLVKSGKYKWHDITRILENL